MDEMQNNNHVILCGAPVSEPVYSHESRSEPFYTFPLNVTRLSGAVDRINILLRRSLLGDIRPSPAGLVGVEGELRSFNNRGGEGSRLVISVFARSLWTPQEPTWENQVELTGTLCKAPTHRTTPMGREITDLMVAVNRPYGRSDYLPCIAWGQTARMAAEWPVGTRIRLAGRIQSREYIKNLDGQAIRRVAYEVSVAELSLA